MSMWANLDGVVLLDAHVALTLKIHAGDDVVCADEVYRTYGIYKIVDWMWPVEPCFVSFLLKSEISAFDEVSS